MQTLARLTCLTALLLAAVAGADESDIEGRWLSGDRSGWIEIRLLAGKPVGVAAGATNAEERARLDDHNPDPALRSRALLGITILHGFEYAGDRVWKGGTIYDPNSGNTYRSSMTLLDRNTLKVRGYIGLAMFGRSDTWTRDDP